MKLVREHVLVESGKFPSSTEMVVIRQQLGEAVRAVVWPAGSKDFAIHPERKGNGVKPIKDAVMATLHDRFQWDLEYRSSIGVKTREAGCIDAVKRLPGGRLFAVEWETGNISSSHRSLNKLGLGMLQGVLVGGALILPTRSLYNYLTDRIGNYEELSPYFPFWNHLRLDEGLLTVLAVEHDRESRQSPRIPKGTDGRALR